MYTINLCNKQNIIRKGFIKLVDCMPRVIPNEAGKLKCISSLSGVAYCAASMMSARSSGVGAVKPFSVSRQQFWAAAWSCANDQEM